MARFLRRWDLDGGKTCVYDVGDDLERFWHMVFEPVKNRIGYDKAIELFNSGVIWRVFDGLVRPEDQKEERRSGRNEQIVLKLARCSLWVSGGD